MTKTLPKAYFENRAEQAKIKLALLKAIPAGVAYCNLIIALTEMLDRTIRESFIEELTIGTGNDNDWTAQEYKGVDVNQTARRGEEE